MPSVADAVMRQFYRFAYPAARLFWLLAQPRTRSVNVVVWSDGRVLLVRHSYKRGYSLPGGFCKRGEAPQDAALRELREEVGLKPAPSRLKLTGTGNIHYHGKRETVFFFEMRHVPGEAIHVDRREIIRAHFKPLHRALTFNLPPHVHSYLSRANISLL